ncbi:hypothetical protein H5410_045528, partial [Solanum commersonii]
LKRACTLCRKKGTKRAEKNEQMKASGSPSPLGESAKVGGKREQSAHHRANPQSSTILPNGPEHEGWNEKAMNYTKSELPS